MAFSTCDIWLARLLDWHPPPPTSNGCAPHPLIPALTSGLPTIANLVFWNIEDKNRKGEERLWRHPSNVKSLMLSCSPEDPDPDDWTLSFLVILLVSAVSSMIPQAFERLVLLLEAFEKRSVSLGHGMSLSGLVHILGQQPASRYPSHYHRLAPA